jgi:hypothetical protein
MKKGKRRDHSATTSFQDLMFNMILGLTCFFLISVLLINPKKKKETSAKPHAEFIITITWEKGSDDDVDSYLQDPAGNILFFNAREVGIMHLDRDDLGQRNDVIQLPNGETVLIEDNREIITLRGIVPGEYVLNVHMYSKSDQKPVDVTITIDKINPYSAVLSKTVQLKSNGQEETVCRFTLDPSGTVSDISYLPKRLTQNIEGEGEEYDY